jgi:predicted O-linked N-acetylglucosamine transferase (SPINDLY family)
MTATLNRAARRKAERLQRRKSRGNGAGSAGPVRVSLMEFLTAAVEQHQAGNLEVAEKAYRQVLAADPDNPDALQLLGVVHHQRGDSGEGLALLERALELAPDNPEIHVNLGGVLRLLEREDEAEARYRRALEIAPGHLEAQKNLIGMLGTQERRDEAIQTCEQALEHAPGHALIHKLLANQLIAQHRYEPARDALERYTACFPDDARAMNDLAICHKELGDPVKAEDSFLRAVALGPEVTEIRYNLAIFLVAQGRGAEAEPHFDAVLKGDQDTWMVMAALALSLARQGKIDEATATLRRVAESHPDDPVVWNDVGAQFMFLEKFEEAREMFARAVELDPERVEPITNLGNAYLKMHRGYEAAKAYETALKLRPRHLEAHVSLCRALRETYHNYDEANLYARATILLEGFGPRYAANPLQVLRQTCDYEGLEELGPVWEICDAIQPDELLPLFLQLLVYAEDGETNLRLAQNARRWARNAEKIAEQAPLPKRPRTRTDSKIRLGFLSSDLRVHSVSRFILPLLTNYDRDRFEVYCYSSVRIDADPIQAKYREQVDKFTFVQNMTDREVATVIQEDEIDVLFDLNGFTHGTKLAAMAYRPAPVQVSWLGYPFTTGLEAMDYVLADRFFKPARDDLMVEKPLVMPGSWICFGEGVLFDPVEISETLPVEQNGVITFGTLNSPYKFRPETFKFWAEVMKAIPDSRFLVVRPECGSVIACGNMAKAFAEHGIAPDRLFFINNRGKGIPHLAYYNAIDISLDTFPLTGGTTTCEALWMGVPVVTLVGESLHQRISHAILCHCGLEELCARNEEEFVAAAVSLAKDRERLNHLRHGLRATLQSSPLARPDLFVEQFQKVMEEVASGHERR